MGTSLSSRGKKMKIVFLSRYQNTTERGAEVFVKELTSHLSKAIEVEVLSGGDADNLAKVFCLNPDIVVPINGRLQSFKVSLGRLIKPYKMIISGHSGMGRDDWWNILVRPNVFVALTEAMKRWALPRSLGVKIAKIPNGIDLERFNPQGAKIDLTLPRPIILSVGALTKHKHHERTIRAVANLDRGSLLILGKGEEESALLSLGKELLGERFSIKSFDYSQMPDLYRSVDLFTLLSWDREAFGIVYLEAMASGLAVVAPLDDSRQEIVGDGGILVNVEDLSATSQAIKQALEINWKNKPRAQAEKFAWTRIADIYGQLFEETGK